MDHHDGSSSASQLSQTQKAYGHLRNRVTSGELAPGTRLVTRNIAKEIGTSLNPVREAIGRLASEGIIEHVPGAGAFVRNPDRQELIELYGMREAIEVFAAAEAARLISEPEINDLQALCDEFHKIAKAIQSRGEATREESHRWYDLTVHFHQILVDAAHNRYLSKALNQYRLVSGIFEAHRQRRTTETLSTVAITWGRLTRLVRALRKRDPEAASALVRHMIRAGRQRTLAAFYGGSSD